MGHRGSPDESVLRAPWPRGRRQRRGPRGGQAPVVYGEQGRFCLLRRSGSMQMDDPVLTVASKNSPGVGDCWRRRYFDNAHTRTQTWLPDQGASGAWKWDKTAARAHGSRERTCAAAPVVDAAQGMLTRPPPAAPPCSDGCGFCRSLERCASAQNERTKDLAAHTCGRSRLLTAAPCFSSQSTTSVVRLFASSRRASSAPALTLHRVRGNVGLLTAQRAIDGARAPPLILCAADN